MSRLNKSAFAAVLLALATILPACQSSRGTGTGVGVGLGAGIGALADDDNPWRGAAIGGVLGGLLGYAVGDTIEREKEAAGYDAYHEDRVVVRDVHRPGCEERYRIQSEPSRDGRRRVVTTVWEENSHGEWVVVSEEEQDIR